ncbi:helix-turn-helix domain-containing protein [Rhizobium sp. GN54]|uniref:helix-turn-helix domain-containing protein n=1 Tax=Rhizobium sp. GN54 TaxID=2898150 RepID=UPI003FA7A4D2
MPAGSSTAPWPRKCRRPWSMREDRPLPAEPLFTPEEAATRLSISVKTLMKHVREGRLRYINVGTEGRKARRFSAYNLSTFIETQKVRETPKCPSTKAPKALSTSTTFKSNVVAFSALPKPATKKTPKQ